MVEIRLYHPGSTQPIPITLAAGVVALVGRNPDPNQLEPRLTTALAGAEMHLVSKGLESLDWISRNHLLLHHRSDGVWLTDLSSRSGAWLRLRPGTPTPVSLPTGAPLALQLTPDPHEARRQRGPRSRDWSTTGEFTNIIIAVVREWLEEMGIDAELKLDHDDEERQPKESLPLADGMRIQLMRNAHGRTGHISWPQALDLIHQFVQQQNARFERERGHDEDFVLASPSYRAAHEKVAEAAAWGARVVLIGPTGSGKERLARCYHLHSDRREGPFVPLNCALLSPSMLQVQLFGARKGAYTGAENLRGLVSEADGGTLFLDEVGRMPLDVQGSLLRFLDTKGEYRPVGEVKPRRANIRLVCATNVALHNPVERQGRFLDDLWHRLAVHVIELDPLHQRPDDIACFLRTHTSRGASRSVWDLLSPAAREFVLRAPLEGNFRDLEHFVDRLPPGNGLPGSIDEKICQAALPANSPSAERVSVSSRPSVGSKRRDAIIEGEPDVLGVPDSKGVVPSKEPERWHQIQDIALSAFVRDIGAPPISAADLAVYHERYLKPVWMAFRCSVQDAPSLPAGLNYSQLARQLNVADGKTVLAHLRKFFEIRRGP